MKCPRCGHQVAEHSTFVERMGVVGEEFAPEAYHPNAKRRYKTTAKQRRVALAYYWKNRKKVLAREKRRRARQNRVSVSMYD